jgi:hypothetical protein
MTTAVSARPIRVLAAGLALALLGGATPTMAQVDVEERERTAELELVAATIWQAVMMRDLETLLRYVRPEALEDTRRPLTMADSGLACALFDTRCLQRHLPPDETGRTSIVDFFRTQPGARLRVTYLGMAMFGLESPLDLAMVTWVVPGSNADRKFPAHDLSTWGEDHVNTCLIYTRTTGWRFHSGVGVFFCPNSLFLKPDPR